MAQVHNTRRQHYGSIDFDFYRAEATALRSQARRDAFKCKEIFGFTVATLATALVLALIPALARSGEPNNMSWVRSMQKSPEQVVVAINGYAEGKKPLNLADF